MLECRTCLSRALRAIASDSHITGSTLQRPLALTPRLNARTSTRPLATAVANPQRVPEDALSGLQRVEQPKIDPRSTNKKGGPIVIHNEKALLKELDYLKDPVKLSEHVSYTLRDNKPDKALDLCRLATRKQLDCTVSWNHVIGWNIKAGRTNKAFEIFNEMKKRGQFPDSYTYIRILHGLTERPEHSSKAVSVYNTLFSPTSRVKPNIMHTNVALRVCALAQDMDGLWGIVSRLPEEGPNSADSTTYTTILQAVRHSALGDEIDEISLARKRQEAVNEGRRIWQEIIAKWRMGTLGMDEKLIVAMADLLLISRRMQDWDDVLNLVHQTMNIERLVPELGSSARNTEHVPKSLTEDESNTVREDPDGFVPTPSTSAFKAVTPLAPDPNHPMRSKPLEWIAPGNGILSVLVRACGHMRAQKGAYAYWATLTSDPYNVVPDITNLHQLLRFMRIDRRAGMTANLLPRMHDGLGVEAIPVTYRMAMSVCQRDIKNPNVVDHATIIIDDMAKHLSRPDEEALEAYLSIAQATRNGPKIVLALNRVYSLLLSMFRDYRPGLSISFEDQAKLSKTIKECNQAVSLVQTTIGAVDTLLQNALVPKQSVNHWHERRNQLNQYLSKAKQHVKKLSNVHDERATAFRSNNPFLKQTINAHDESATVSRSNDPSSEQRDSEKRGSEKRFPQKSFSEKRFSGKSFPEKSFPEKSFAEKRVPEKRISEKKFPFRRDTEKRIPGQRSFEKRSPLEAVAGKPIPGKRLVEKRMPEKRSDRIADFL